MAGSRQFRPVVWNAFSQQPIRPELGENPVTRVVNMELTPEKTIRTRRGFTGGLDCNPPESHVTAHLVNSSSGSDLIMQVGDQLKIKAPGGVTTSDMVTPGTWGNVSPESPGFFSVYGGEVYYCQSGEEGYALFSYDGAVSRNIGVPGLFGDYSGDEPTIHTAVDFAGATDYCGYYCQSSDGVRTPSSGLYCCGTEGADGSWNGNCGFGDTVDIGCQSGANCTDSSPCPEGDKTFLCMPQQGTLGGTFCWHVANSAGQNSRGEKILNCAFKVGYYDPKRGIFGRACEPKSVINFGPNRDQYAMYQYHIRVNPPTGVEDLGLAVWCSPGQEVMTVKIPGEDFWSVILYNEVHGMSDHLTDMMFLEDLIQSSNTPAQSVDCGDTGGKICLFKDQATLADSGRYTEQYEMPVPSKAMAILPGGTALYLFPLQVTSLESSNRWTYSGTNSGNGIAYNETGDHRPGIEYSVNHPEQIGRNSYNQKETFSPCQRSRESRCTPRTAGAHLSCLLGNRSTNWDSMALLRFKILAGRGS